LTIHFVKCKSREEFRKIAPQRLLAIHKQTKLDLIEAPEYGAESIYVKHLMPEVPLIVKLHTPGYLVKRFNDFYFDKRIDRRIKHFFATSNYKKDEDYIAAIKADYLLSPSHSLGDIISNDWKIERSKIIHAPNPYKANINLLRIPPETTSKTILYIGRLETRKGVYKLSQSIPLVIKEIPDANFIFLGKDDRSPWRKNSMKQFLMEEIGACINHVQFIEQVSLFDIPGYLSQADICVFPSIWENFPNVCLEAMASGRGIVASKNGGMVDMLSPVDESFLVDPQDANEIATAIIYLLKNKTERINYGRECRVRAVSYYSGSLVEELINLYQELAERRL
jgi:glycosyltransferase involved in cell wall biosynthesis